ncbi:MAG: class I SAM-dependent methyltransferase [Gemmatimonadota bacterium]
MRESHRQVGACILRAMIPPDYYSTRIAPMAPYEAALVAYHAGAEDAGIRLRSSLGEDEVLPAEVFFRHGEALFPFERYALELARGRILDLGAGAGVHTLELQDRGHDVVALENCGALVDLMRERGARTALRADFRWWRGPRFDTVLMLMNGIGPTATLAGLDRFFTHAQSFVTEGGQLLVDSAEAVPEPAPEPDDGVDRSVWPDAGGYAGQAWIDLEFEGRRGLPFRELYTDVETLRERATDAGWTPDVAFEEDGAFLLRLTLR